MILSRQARDKRRVQLNKKHHRFLSYTVSGRNEMAAMRALLDLLRGKLFRLDA
eukprot:COSAG06_NODE_26812_length_607_cov_0.576772_1_plen_52_part_10